MFTMCKGLIKEADPRSYPQTFQNKTFRTCTESVNQLCKVF